jgi:RNA polymerase sigma-70 factor (sigma-E family)
MDALAFGAAPPEEMDSIATLYGATAPKAVRLAYLLTADRALAEDIVQDAFIRVAARLGKLRDANAVEAYLRRAVVNEVQGRRRSLERRQRRERTATAGRATPAVSPMETVDQRIDLIQALNALPLQQRVTLLLRYWMDLGEAEIAETMNCAVGTVKSRLFRGLATLREVSGNDD